MLCNMYLYASHTPRHSTNANTQYATETVTTSIVFRIRSYAVYVYTNNTCINIFIGAHFFDKTLSSIFVQVM